MTSLTSSTKASAKASTTGNLVSKRKKVTHPKHGEIKCQGAYSSGKKKGEPCGNGAYFAVKKSQSSSGSYTYLCGQHSRGNKDVRVELEKMSTREKKEKKDDALEQMETAAKLAASNAIGTVCMVRMVGMFPHVPLRPGWLNVYPNYKSNWQGIGLVMPALSPMSLGPVVHGQPGLPNAKNIENFHQFSKYFSDLETEEEYKLNRVRGYTDSTPHRHKFPKIAAGTDETKRENKNIPDYFVWVDKKGEEHHLVGTPGYIVSRQFYCNFYDRLASVTEEFLKLKDLLARGYSLQICGPDAFPMETILGATEPGLDEDEESKEGIDKESIDKEKIVKGEETYLDPAHPFGHERVLYTMLTVSTPDSWPWRKHKTFDF